MNRPTDISRERPLSSRHGIRAASTNGSDARAAADVASAGILLVDDNAANLLATAAILEPLGHSIMTAQSGADALKCLLQRDFAVILMDVQMPGLDGLQTARLIKERERSRHIPIIFLTAISRSASLVLKGYSHGAVDYLLKPFEPEVLRSKVSVFVDLYLKREQIKRQQTLLREREIEAIERRNDLRFRRLTDAMPQCVWMVDAMGRVEYCNKSWEEFSGLGLSDSAEFGSLPPIHPDERERVREAWSEALESRRPFEMEYRLKRHRDGVYRWHLVRALPAIDEHGEIYGWIATATDIDDQKRTEAQLATLLDREKVLREAAETANRAKDEFLATVSHELRTPLSAILGWTQMLRRAKPGTLDVPQALATIERNARVQIQLTDDLLEVSRVNTGMLRLNVQSVDLNTVLVAAADAVRPVAEAKSIKLELVPSAATVVLSCDADRIQQALSNLLHNSIKFTPGGGAVRASIARVNGDVQIDIADTGEGIRADFSPHVFDRFRQADASSTRRHGGLGLGLAIVRNIVDLHGGTIRAESPGEGRGATFTVTLPIGDAGAVLDSAPTVEAGQTEAPVATPSLPTAPQDLSGVDVLFVDDDPDARTLAIVALGQRGAVVRAVASTVEAVETAALRWPDVLVSDIAMPGEDGYALLRRIREIELERGGRVPCLALTAYARAEDRQIAMASGFDAYASKPIEPVDLVAIVADLARKTRSRSETRRDLRD